jgi:Ca2+-transporting ATPase
MFVPLINGCSLVGLFEIAPTLSLLLGLLCSNAQLQLMDKQLNNEEIKQKAMAEASGREFKAPEKEWQAVGNATDRPVVVAAFKAGYRTDIVDPVFQRVRENPFNSARKMMSVIITTKAEVKSNPSIAAGIPFPELFEPVCFAIAKGAPNIILDHCVSIQVPGPDGAGVTRALTAQDRSEILKSIDELSAQAFRVLAVGYQPLTAVPGPDFTPEQCEDNLILTGLIASIDPERPGVKESINHAAKAGIRVVMITGDYLLTAKAIAENISILPPNSSVDQAVDCARVREVGDEINMLMKALAKKDPAPSRDEKASLKKKLDAANVRVDNITKTADVYARAKPSDKITIVRSLQRQGNVCSMTGDGVNDAPALKQADIGVAMGITGTAVAKSAAKIVLTDDNFISIVAAIEEGRTIYNNITKFVFYLLSTNVSEVMLILFAICLGLPSPLVPIQILWLNLVTDGAPAIALAVEPSEPGVMEQGPRLMSEPLLEKLMLTGVLIHTIILTSCCLGTYFIGLYWHTSENQWGSWNGGILDIRMTYPFLFSLSEPLTTLTVL